ncbi:MAG: cyclodeaminase/cyclohydrolase family protein, partial [Clostridia bacterium]
MKLYERSVMEFCNDVAADIPVPGGGSVAALNAALGASLIQMVGNMTARKAVKNEVEIDYEVSNAIIKCKNAQEELIELIEKDSAAFNKVMAAMKLPKTNSDEKLIRSAAIQESYKTAVMPPLTVAMMAYDLIDCGAVM